jgi:hypothetical protein
MKIIILALPMMSACTLLQLEAELPKACITRSGVPVAGSLGRTSTAFSIALADLGAAKDLLQAGDELIFTHFAARPAAPPAAPSDALAFIDGAEISLGPVTPDATMPPLLAFACTGDCNNGEGSLDIAGTSHDNAIAYLRAPMTAVTVALSGKLPAQPWTLDVEVCLSGTLTRTLKP